MTDLVAIVKKHREAMRKWSKKALQRNYIVDENKVVWCPVRMSEISKRYANPKRSLLNFICNVYYPGESIEFSSCFIVDYASRIINSWNNNWLSTRLDAIKNKLIKRKHELTAEQCDLLLYKSLLKIDLDISFLLTDAYFLEPNEEDFFIYIPTANPTEDGDTSKRLAKGKASSSSNVLTRRKDSAHFLYVDVGAWSSPQKRGTQGHAPFAIITANEIAIWDILATKGQVRNGKGLRPDGAVYAFWKKYHKVLRGHLIFYGYIPPNKGLHVIQGNRRRIFSYKPFIPTPFAKNEEMLVVIPDLHLHMFPNFAVDNFLEPWKDGQSLGIYLSSLWTYLADFNKNSPYYVRLIQVGDLYELWESACIMLFARRLRMFEAFGKIGFLKSRLLRWRSLLQAEIEKRGLDKIFSNKDMEMLEKYQWDSKELLGVWDKMKKEIQKAHRIKDIAGNEVGLFDKKGRINCKDLPNWTHIGGNHDSFVSDVTPRKYGINDCIWMEHGHLNDPKNNPANINEGVFWTGCNVIAELKQWGDQAKELDSNRRPLFLRNAAAVNINKFLRKKERAYSLIVTGHTHSPYIALLRVRKDLPKHFEIISVLYDQGWKELKLMDYIKKLPGAFETAHPMTMTTGGVFPAFSTIFRVMTGLSRIK